MKRFLEQHLRFRVSPSPKERIEEALRWHQQTLLDLELGHKILGQLNPTAVKPLMLDLGEWVLHTLCPKIAQGKNRGSGFLEKFALECLGSGFTRFDPTPRKPVVRTDAITDKEQVTCPVKGQRVDPTQRHRPLSYPTEGDRPALVVPLAHKFIHRKGQAYPVFPGSNSSRSGDSIRTL